MIGAEILWTEAENYFSPMERINSEYVSPLEVEYAPLEVDALVLV